MMCKQNVLELLLSKMSKERQRDQSLANKLIELEETLSLFNQEEEIWAQTKIV